MGGTAWCLSPASHRDKGATFPLLTNVRTPPGATRRVVTFKRLFSQAPTRWRLFEGREVPSCYSLRLSDWTEPRTLGTSMRAWGADFMRLCQSSALRDPDRPLAKVELWGGTCLIRWASCVHHSPLLATGLGGLCEGVTPACDRFI